MIEILHSTGPIARKEYRCCFCTDLIHIGEKYNRDTIIYDGRIYDWISHNHCREMIRILNIEPYDEAIDTECFCDAIDNYVMEKHFDKEIDDIEKEWQGKNRHELVEMIWKENQEKINQA